MANGQKATGKCARYFGLPSPACSRMVGQPIGNTRSTLDAYGNRLVTAALPGDGYRTQHDAIKWRLDADLREMGIRARSEVYGLFADRVCNARKQTQRIVGKIYTCLSL